MGASLASPLEDSREVMVRFQAARLISRSLNVGTIDVSELVELDLEPVGELLDAEEPTARASAATLLSCLSQVDPSIEPEPCYLVFVHVDSQPRTRRK